MLKHMQRSTTKQSVYSYYGGSLQTFVAFCCCECCFVLASCLGYEKENVRPNWWKSAVETINDSWKCTSTKTLDKNKKTLILVFICRHYKTSLRKSFEVMNEMFTFNRFRVYISICIVALSSNRVLLVLILFFFLCFMQVAQISFYKLHCETFRGLLNVLVIVFIPNQ